MMNTVTMSCPKICANAEFLKNCQILFDFFSGAFRSAFEFCQNLFSFFEKLSEVSKSFYSLIMPLSHFGENWELTFSGM